MSRRGSWPKRRGVRRAASWVVLLLIGLIGLVTPGAAAQTPDAVVDVQLVLGYGGIGAGAAWIPATVTFRPDQPISGRVEVTSSGPWGDRTVAQAIEVAAGAPVAVRVVVPPGQVAARVVVGDEVIGDVPRRAIDRPGLVLGVLGADQVDAPSVEIQPLAASARWVGVDRAWVDVPRGLAALDALVLPAGAWRELDAPARDRVWAEVATGGMTLVVTDPGDATELPRPLQLDAPPPDAHTVRGQAPDTTVAVVAPAGLGRVALVPGGPAAVRDGDVWAVVTGPRGVVDPIADAEAHETQPFAAQQLLSGIEGGRLVAGIPYLGLFLLVYLLVVGPLNVLALRRWGRPELAWLTVPAIALVFAAVPLVLTRSPGGAAPLAGQHLTWWVDDVGQERLALAWRPTRTGPVRAVLEGRSWVATPWGDSRAGALLVGGGDLALEGEVRVGEVAGLLATRPAGRTAPLQVRARVSGGDVEVEVSNEGAQAVRGLTVVVGNQFGHVGDLAAGETMTHTMDGRLSLGHLNLQAVRVGLDGTAMAGEMVMPDGTVVQQRAVGPGGMAEGPMVMEDGMFIQQFGGAVGLFPAPLRMGTPGVAWAVGTVEAAEVPARIGGAQVAQIGHTVAVGTRIDVGLPARRVPPAAVLGQVMTPDAGGEAQVPNALHGERVVVRFRLPVLAPSSQLSGSLRGLGGAADVQIWDATARTWRDVASDVSGLAADSLPTTTGELYVRLVGPVDGAGVAVVQPGDPPAPGPADAPPGMGMPLPGMAFPEPPLAAPMTPPGPRATGTLQPLPHPSPPRPAATPSHTPTPPIPGPIPAPTPTGNGGEAR